MITVEHYDLVTVIQYADTDDIAIVLDESRYKTGKIVEVQPRGLKVKVFYGEYGTTNFYKWSDVQSIKKNKVKRPFSLFEHISKCINYFKFLLRKGV